MYYGEGIFSQLFNLVTSSQLDHELLYQKYVIIYVVDCIALYFTVKGYKIYVIMSFTSNPKLITGKPALAHTYKIQHLIFVS